MEERNWRVPSSCLPDVPIGRMITITVVVTIVLASTISLVILGMDTLSVVGLVTLTLGAVARFVYHLTRPLVPAKQWSPAPR